MNDVIRVQIANQLRLGRGRPRLPGLILVLIVCLTLGAEAAPKSWTNSVSDFWQGAANWNPASAPGSTDVIWITNATTKTVTVDGTTPVGNLTISALILTGPAGTENTLYLADAVSPLLLSGVSSILSFGIGAGGNLVVSNATLDARPSSAANLYLNGPVTLLDGGSLLHTNANAANVYLGRDYGSGINGNGTLTIAGGKFESRLTGSDGFRIGYDAGRTGAVWLTSGELVLTNAGDRTFIGHNGVGSLVVSNGTARLRDLGLGVNAGSRGTLVIAGGTVELGVGGNPKLLIGNGLNATGIVQVTGGTLLATNGAANGITVGSVGSGEMTVSGGTVLTRGLNVGGNASSAGVGTLAVSGTGHLQVTVPNGFGVGRLAGSTGYVSVSGGTLLATNSGYSIMGWNGTANFEQTGGTVRISHPVFGNVAGGLGTLTLSGGTFESLDGTLGGGARMIVGLQANSTGMVVVTGGTLRNSITLGESAGALGRLTISGGLLTNAALTVGSSGTGRFTVQGADGTIKLTSYSQNSSSTFNPQISSAGITPVVVSGSATRGGTLDLDLQGGIALLQTNVFTLLRKQSGSIGGAFATTAPSVFTVATATDGADALLQATLDPSQMVFAFALTNTQVATFAPANKGWFQIGTNGISYSDFGVQLAVDTNSATATLADLVASFSAAGYNASVITNGVFDLQINFPTPTTQPLVNFAWDFSTIDANLLVAGATIVPEPGTVTLLWLGVWLVARRKR